MADVLSTREAAQYLRRSAGTVMRLARQGHLPAAKLGRRWSFRKPDLDAWLSETPEMREQIEDEGIAIVLRERKADPANRVGMPLEQFLRERGL